MSFQTTPRLTTPSVGLAIGAALVINVDSSPVDSGVRCLLISGAGGRNLSVCLPVGHEKKEALACGVCSFSARR